MSNLYLEKYTPVVRLTGGLKTKLPVTLSGTAANLAVGGTLTVTGASTFTGEVSSPGGQVQAGTVQSTVWHSGGYQPTATTGTTSKQIVTTETYFAEVFVPDNTTITGISVLNGTTTSASQNTFVGLANAAGTIVASSNTTTAQAAANTYQQIPFSTPYSAIGPAKYFIAVQGSATTGFIATHTIGNFGASKQTGETYGTFLTTATYKVTTFTTAVGPIADTY
jgi:hypothetical protein